MISQLFTQNTYKILSLFSVSPGSRLNRKEIKKMVRLNNIPLDNALSVLVSSGVLKREKNLYSVDFECGESRKLLDIISRERAKTKDIPIKVYLVLVDVVSLLSVNKDVHAYLFGSYSKLIYTEKSDIDIAVLTTKGFDSKVLQRRIEKLENVYGERIELHFLDREAFYKNKNDPLVKDIVRNGTRLI